MIIGYPRSVRKERGNFKGGLSLWNALVFKYPLRDETLHMVKMIAIVSIG